MIQCILKKSNKMQKKLVHRLLALPNIVVQSLYSTTITMINNKSDDQQLNNIQPWVQVLETHLTL